MAANNTFAQGWVLLPLIALLLFLNAGKGLTSGRAILFFRYVKRSENAYLYWRAVVMSAIGGIAVLVPFVAGNTAFKRDSLLLILALALLYNTGEGLVIGRALLFLQDVNRSEDGYLFWLAVLISAILGIGCLVSIFL